MLMHESGNPGGKAVLVLHGLLCPLGTVDFIVDALGKRFRILTPVLGGHGADAPLPFVSLEYEAAQIASWLLERSIGHLHAVIGFSFGGAAAYALWLSRRVAIDTLVLDGAPLVGCNRLMAAAMSASYRQILKGSKARNIRTIANFKRTFLPERFLEDYLSIADQLDAATLTRMVGSVCQGRITADMPENTRLIVLHGTKMPGEWLSRQSARRLQKLRPQTEIIPLKKRGHCELAIWHPQDYLQTVIPMIE